MNQAPAFLPECPDEVLFNPNLSRVQVIVWLALRKLQGEGGALRFTLTQVAERLRMSKPQVSRAVQELEEIGFLLRNGRDIRCTLPVCYLTGNSFEYAPVTAQVTKPHNVTPQVTKESDFVTPQVTTQEDVTSQVTNEIDNVTPQVTNDLSHVTAQVTKVTTQVTNLEKVTSQVTNVTAQVTSGPRARASLSLNTNTNNSTGSKRESAGAGAREEASPEAGSWLNALGISNHRGTPVPTTAPTVQTSQPFHNDPEDLAELRGTTPNPHNPVGVQALNLFTEKAGRVPPMYHAELIQSRVTDLAIWQATLETWEAMEYRWIVPSVLERYAADVNAIHGSGASKKPSTSHGTTPQDAEDARLEALYGHLF